MCKGVEFCPLTGSTWRESLALGCSKISRRQEDFADDLANDFVEDSLNQSLMKFVFETHCLNTITHEEADELDIPEPS
jgi:hypothetical protein